MTSQDAIPTSHQKALLTTQEFNLLCESGTFLECAKAELLDGEIYTMNAQHRPHVMAKMDLYDAIRDQLKVIGTTLRAVLEATVELDARNAPEPDIILTSEPYGEGAIPVSSVALIVEISDTTLKMDMGKKQAIYAQAGVAEYWVVDLEGDKLHQMWSVKDQVYREKRELPFGAQVNSETVKQLAITLDIGSSHRV
jgi:Uma2 family endonuclease